MNITEMTNGEFIQEAAENMLSAIAKFPECRVDFEIATKLGGKYSFSIIKLDCVED